MAHFPTDRFLTSAELDAAVDAFAEAHPELVRVEVVGESFEGRAIRVVTLTELATGPASDKPALWVDGNIHSTELAASTACLHHIEEVVRRHAEGDATIRALLAGRAFYVCPRVNPDGADWALADPPRFTRSSVRPHPFDEIPIRGHVLEDVDGDGRILSMRVADPNGPWKVSEADPRLLVRREPDEQGGAYFRVLPEGHIRGFDGVTLPPLERVEGLDLNRNFPAQWRQEHEESGAGLYPTSEPEVRAIVDFIARHPNITGAITFHTFSGVLLRPYSYHPDEEMPAEDLWTFQKIGRAGERLTGYPARSCYHAFRYHPKETTHGAFDDWVYEHLGLFAWTVEIWSPRREAGIESFEFIEWYRDHPVEDDLKMLAWSDEALGGAGFIDWYPFEHPQLGPVEIGGWDAFKVLRNPPLDRLGDEVARFPDWLIFHLQISPRLELLERRVEPLAAGLYRLRVAIQNTGWLPTYVTKQALSRKITRGVVLEIELGDGVALRSGERRHVAGQLEGRAYAGAVALAWTHDATRDRLVYDWVLEVEGAQGEVCVNAHHPRAGRVSERVMLGA